MEDKDALVNPYTFVRTPDRNHLPTGLNDGAPPGHHQLKPDLYSGHLTVELETLSPLLIPAQLSAVVPRGRDRLQVETRQTPSGLPLLLGSSVKGMIRSAYEAITNSRMGVVDDHAERLTVRSATGHGRGALLARVAAQREPSSEVRVALSGIVRVKSKHVPKEERREPGQRWRAGVAWVQPRSRSNTGRVRVYNDLIIVAEPEAAADSTSTQLTKPEGLDRLQEYCLVEGYFRIAGRTIRGKTHEHFFVQRIVSPDCSPTFRERLLPHADKEMAVDGEALTAYDAVIRDYQRKLGELTSSDITRAPYVDDSRYLRDGGGALPEGLILFAATFRRPDGSTSVSQLTPALISRIATTNPPRTLIERLGLLPTGDRTHLSSAERLFGTIGTENKHPRNKAFAYRGQVGGGPAVASKAQLESVDVALGALGRPNPRSFRFYTGTSKQDPLHDDKLEVKNAYGEGVTIRGRKVYVTQRDYLRLPGLKEHEWKRVHDHWSQWEWPAPFVSHENVAAKLRKDLASWVPIGTQFTVRLDFINLHKNELAALVWLLHSADAQRPRIHKLGLAKPFGFGASSVRVDCEKSTVRTGVEEADRWRSLQSKAHGDSEFVPDRWLSVFERLRGESSSLKTAVDDWLWASEGVTGTPVHAPRLTSDGGPPEHGYKWYKENASARPTRPLPLPSETLRLLRSKRRR